MFKNDNTEIINENIPRYKWVKLIIYIELIWKSLSTNVN